MRILVLNAGSSTVKFAVFETADPARSRRRARGLLDGIGGSGRASLVRDGGERIEEELPLPDHRAALERIEQYLRDAAGIDAVGHRVVHGGERFRESVRIDADVLRGIEDCAVLAPLHNPGNLEGIRAAAELLGERVPQVAVFDTAFHATMPETSYLYGLPYELYSEHGIRRYGFHGTSHRYVAERAREMTGGAGSLITLHLGNGCSACAIRDGVSFDTSMGFTPVEGLVMGTRPGDLDPSLPEHLARRAGAGLDDVRRLLNHESGLLGLSGISSDMRELLRSEDPAARRAIEVFCYRAKKYVGAYFAALGGADALVFTGGIGENAPTVRARIASGLECLGLVLDPERNAALVGGLSGAISAEDSRFRAFVIPTDEEGAIARETHRIVAAAR